MIDKIKVHLASCSKLKARAAQKALTRLFSPLQIELTTHEVDSGVSKQPIDHDTAKGALNRLRALEESLQEGGDFLISIENGIRYNPETEHYVDFAHLLIKHNGTLYEQTKDCSYIPRELVEAMEKDEAGNYTETWGEASVRLKLAEHSNDPHQAECFAGISREELLYSGLCELLSALKREMVGSINPEEEKSLELSRWLELKKESRQDELSEAGIFHEQPEAPIKSRAVNLYNQGCPLDNWQLSEKKSRNELIIFQTGDPFSVISPEVTLSGKNVNIHCGLEHEHYSVSTLIQEALQLCRAAYEHGAREISISLPEILHPMLHPNDFNRLLVELLKASGANKAYYYDKTFRGKLEDVELASKTSMALSREKLVALRAYLNPYQENSTENPNIESQIQSRMRQKRIKSFLQMVKGFDGESVHEISLIDAEKPLSVPERKVRPRILICGAVNKPLAEEMAESLRQKGEIVRVHQVIGHGINASITTDAELCGARVSIVQSTRPNPENEEAVRDYATNGATNYFYEALVLANEAVLRGAAEVNLINPYQFGARSDKAEDNINGRTGAYVQHNGQLINAAKISKVVTAECHDVHTLSGSYTNDHLRGQAVPALSVIAERLANFWLDNNELIEGAQLRLVTPDAGAAKRTKELTLKLQKVLGDRLCKQRILGEKNRSSHDENPLISALNAGDVSFSPKDKYLITDDETATGSTLCQAIIKLIAEGARNLSVIVVHNNLPLDWLERQLCLARFLFLGTGDIHFSNTNEMGELASSYADLISKSMSRYSMSQEEVEAIVSSWFEKNIQKKMSLPNANFNQFKETISELMERVTIHSLASLFADKIKTKPYFTSPHAFNFRVQEILAEIRDTNKWQFLSVNDLDLPAYTVAARYLARPVFVTNQKSSEIEVLESIPEGLLEKALNEVEQFITAIKAQEKLNKDPIKLLAIGREGRQVAGLVCDALYQKGEYVGLALTEEGEGNVLTLDEDCLNVDEVCIPIGTNLMSCHLSQVASLCLSAKVHCPYVCNLTQEGRGIAQEQVQRVTETQNNFKTSGQMLFFNALPQVAKPKKQPEETKQNEAGVINLGDFFNY